MSRCLPVLLVSLLYAPMAPALPKGVPDELAFQVDLGPIVGMASSRKSIAFNRASRHKMRVFDAQDGEHHLVVGISLRELIETLAPPKAADTILLSFKNGMQVAIAKTDNQAIDDLFIALEHSPSYDEYELVYRLKTGATIDCPRVVYQSKDPAFSPLRLADTLRAVQFVTLSAYDAQLAQPTRQPPTAPGWRLYRKYCGSCHGLGGQGATYAPDFISDMDAYRRVPPLAETDLSQHPSLHEKVKGRVEGRMPPLGHVPDRDIALIWRWLHAIHKGATK